MLVSGDEKGCEKLMELYTQRVIMSIHECATLEERIYKMNKMAFRLKLDSEIASWLASRMT